MKNYITTLAVGLALTVTGFAQEQVDAFQQFVKACDEATTWEQLAAQEVAAFNDATPANEKLRWYAKLIQNYYRMSRADGIEYTWAYNVYPKYNPEPWGTSTNGYAVQYYFSTAVTPKNTAFVRELAASKTPQEVDQAIAAFLEENAYPKKFDGLADSRAYIISRLNNQVLNAAIRVGHPKALNWALLNYRAQKSEKGVNAAVDAVARALKAKDFNIVRANEWIDSQNTGENAPVFSPEEKASPLTPEQLQIVLAANLDALEKEIVKGDDAAALEIAKTKYRNASGGNQLDTAIQVIANVLRAHDLNLKRANEFIQSQKDGTEFDLTVE